MQSIPGSLMWSIVLLRGVSFIQSVLLCGVFFSSSTIESPIKDPLRKRLPLYKGYSWSSALVLLKPPRRGQPLNRGQGVLCSEVPLAIAMYVFLCSSLFRCRNKVLEMFFHAYHSYMVSPSCSFLNQTSACMCACVCVHACVHVCVRMRACVRVCVCVRACVHVKTVMISDCDL